jgi:hypothetical protein
MRNCRGVQRAQALPRARRGTGCRIRNTVFWLIFLAVHSGVVSQVSWTKEVKKARKGESSVSLYDAEGYSALKRSRERGEADSLAPLLTIVVSYPGSYSKLIIFIKFCINLKSVGLNAGSGSRQPKQSGTGSWSD